MDRDCIAFLNLDLAHHKDIQGQTKTRQKARRKGRTRKKKKGQKERTKEKETKPGY